MGDSTNKGASATRSGRARATTGGGFTVVDRRRNTATIRNARVAVGARNSRSRVTRIP